MVVSALYAKGERQCGLAADSLYIVVPAKRTDFRHVVGLADVQMRTVPPRKTDVRFLTSHVIQSVGGPAVRCSASLLSRSSLSLVRLAAGQPAYRLASRLLLLREALEFEGDCVLGFLGQVSPFGDRRHAFCSRVSSLGRRYPGQSIAGRRVVSCVSSSSLSA